MLAGQVACNGVAALSAYTGAHDLIARDFYFIIYHSRFYITIYLM